MVPPQPIGNFRWPLLTYRVTIQNGKKLLLTKIWGIPPFYFGSRYLPTSCQRVQETKSTGGFYQSKGSPCTRCKLQPRASCESTNPTNRDRPQSFFKRNKRPLARPPRKLGETDRQKKFGTRGENRHPMGKKEESQKENNKLLRN